MPRERDSAHATTHQRPRLSPQEKNENKQRVLTHGAPSGAGGIADAVVVKNENLFFLTDPAGIVPKEGVRGPEVRADRGRDDCVQRYDSRRKIGCNRA